MAAAVLHAGELAPLILGRLSGLHGEQCTAEARRLLASNRGERARELAELTATARALVPAGVALIHPDWFAHRTDLSGLSAGTDRRTRNWLARSASAELVDMPTHTLPPITDISVFDLPLLPRERLERGLRVFGCRQLAWALCRGEPSERDRHLDGQTALLAAGLGDDGALLVAETIALRQPRNRVGLGSAKAAARRLAGLASVRQSDIALRAGARGLGARVAAYGGDLARQIAQRMPRHIGISAREELRQSATENLADSPAVAAFIDCVASAP